MPDRSDWLALKRKAAPGPERPGSLQALSRAQVHAEHLTGDEHWDYYQSILQSWIEVYEAELASLKEDWCRVARSPEESRAREARAQIVFAKLGLLRDVLSIPCQLKEKGRAASDALQSRGPEAGAA